MRNFFREWMWFWAAVLVLISCTWFQGYLDGNQSLETADLSRAPKELAPTVAITFDDGPSIYTESLLEGLKQRQVKASFFLLGKNIQGKEAVVEEMYRQGHLIGNHTYSHVQLSKLSKEEAKEEIEKTSELIYNITGEYTNFVRPPYGDWEKELEYLVNMLPVFWSVDPLDWKTDDAKSVVKSVEKEIQDGDIILLHDSTESSVEAALGIVDDLQAKGYEFVTVDELLLE